LALVAASPGGCGCSDSSADLADGRFRLVDGALGYKPKPDCFERDLKLANAAERKAKDNAEEEKEKRERSADDALAVIRFFAERVLAAPRPEEQEGGLGFQATIRDAIDAAEPAIGPAFQDRPLVEASIRDREKTQPDAWITFNTKSLLGQNKYADAEPLLHVGYEGMKVREGEIPAQERLRLTESLERIVQLYDAWDRPNEASAWRQKLEEVRKN
jgi:hypothetical protein